ncbi:MAG TPA: DUF2281 domain-containing protein [Ignavibacteria bacterium]|nr:DUF2281 domain-containing protein [Ignavibacteria bacterium]
MQGLQENRLESVIKKLPPYLKKEVFDFIEFLLSKDESKPDSKLKQNWAGDLKEFRDKYTSLELEKKAIEWRGN